MIGNRLFAIFVALGMLAAACGIPVDSEPELISNDQLPEALQPGTSTTTTIPAQQLTEDVTIFLIDPGDGEPALRPVIREVPVVESGAELELLIFNQLLVGPTSEEQLEGNLTTLIVPTGDEPISILAFDRDVEDQLSVVLSETPAIEGEDRTAAFAQMVFTITEIDGVDDVRFLVRNEDGVDEDIPVKTDTEEGDVTRPVSRSDYSTLRPVSFTTDQ